MVKVTALILCMKMFLFCEKWQEINTDMGTVEGLASDLLRVPQLNDSPELKIILHQVSIIYITL